MRNAAVLGALLIASLASAQTIQNHPYISAEQSNAIANEWTRPMEPFKILDNLYYVGSQNIASYLLTTPQGHILLDTGMPAMHQAVKANTEKLGLKLSDLKIMISSHAHIDHIGGHAEMKKATGAQVMALGEDARALELGKDLSPVEYLGWTPVKVDRVLKDGDTVSLGGVTLCAVWTPGHTPGATTWVTTLVDGGRTYNVVFPGGAVPNPGPPVVGNANHPTLAEDTLSTFRKLRQLNPDIQLPGHPGQIFMGKLDGLRSGLRPHPLLVPAGEWVKGIDAQEAAFRKRMEADAAKLSARQ
jgi:metallo-beta-lactamase class B